MNATQSELFHEMISRLVPKPAGETKVLDFGCGAGQVVRELVSIGYDAYGCDLGVAWPEEQGLWWRLVPEKQWSEGNKGRLRPIDPSPYRLPYPDGMFDVVISMSVLEHANNKEELFREIARVTNPGGIGIHQIPAKWVIKEPHIYVPFASWFWPNVPYWWLKLWAFLGVRNEFQVGLAWREVAALNCDYCRNGLHYWRLRQYRRLFRQIFDGYWDLDPLRLQLGRGRASRLIRVMKIGWLATRYRAWFIEATAGYRVPQRHDDRLHGDNCAGIRP